IVLPRIGIANNNEFPDKVTQLPPIASRMVYSAKAILLAVTHRRRFDLVFCGHLYLAPLAWGIAASLQIPMWLQVHGIEASDPVPAITRRSLERAKLVTTVSRFTRRRILSCANIEPRRVRVLPNTVRPFFFERDGDPNEVLRRYHLVGNDIILTVG